jgi:hypothetical protein
MAKAHTEVELVLMRERALIFELTELLRRHVLTCARRCCRGPEHLRALGPCIHGHRMQGTALGVVHDRARIMLGNREQVIRDLQTE